MYLIRDIMYCRPGKVRPLLEKFRALSALMDRLGMGNTRLLTDIAGERYWTLVSEFEVEDLKAWQEMEQMGDASPEDLKEFERVMTGYHDLVEHGRREIFKIES